MNKIFTRSDTIKDEYSAQIVRIGKLEPIENSDFLMKTTINDAYQVVVGKNDVKEGEIMVYCKLETELNSDFLSVNNQFELSERALNKNFETVENLVNEGKTDEAKKLVGYFNKHGRVRIIKLRGCPSEGCLFPIKSLINWVPKCEKEDFESYIEKDDDGNVIPFNFDTVDGNLFIKAYVPRTSESNNRSGNGLNKRNKKLKRFDRMVDGQFSFHYNTSQLTDNMWKFNPNTDVTISVKVHGTSHIVGRLLVKSPIQQSIPRIMMNKRAKREMHMLERSERRFYWQKEKIARRAAKLNSILADNQYKVGYGKVYSSRSVIKNQYINNYDINNFYGKDIWSQYGDMLYPYIIEGMTVYSEIVGYVDGTQTMIQKNYDYGCNPGESYIMPYRITWTDDLGNKTEWGVDAVYGWTLNLIKDHPEIANKVKPITILYSGKLKDLYPDIQEDYDWHKNVLAALSNDKEHFGMELDEPMCKSKVPREGIVIRINGDKVNEAFKLKTFKFKFGEAQEIDKGNVDIEMADAYEN